MFRVSDKVYPTEFILSIKLLAISIHSCDDLGFRQINSNYVLFKVDR